MGKTIKIFCLFIMSAILMACHPEDLLTEFRPDLASGYTSEDGERAKRVDLPVTVDVSLGEVNPTKATALSGVEGCGSGALVLVYRSSSKQLDSYTFFTQSQLESQASVPLKVNVPMVDCDFFILGNLNYIRKSNGQVVNLMVAMGDDFPVREADLEAFVYRVDGKDVNSVYRRESMADVRTLGIPYQRVEKGVSVASLVNTGKGLPNADKCVWLFSRVDITIDHSGLDGSGMNPSYFVNRRLIVRQVNNRLMPFGTASQKATSAADILAPAGTYSEEALADYDLNMSGSNANRVTVSLYVPENMQGNLLSNSPGSSLLKTPANVSGLCRNYVTYVEFQGSVAPEAGGYSADVTYQFCLGSDAVNNFDLERGRRYDVTLGFTVKNLFVQPEWKVGLDNWTDTRTFRLTADVANATILPEGQMVAVRPNRAGRIFVFSSKSAGGANQLKGKALVDPGYAPSSLTDCGVTSDFMSETNKAADVQNRAWLTERGITPSWDVATGAVSFVVTDVTRFNAHIGDEKVLTMTLLPGDGSKTVSFKVKLYEPISIVWDKPVDSGFFPGMKRVATVKGYAGTVKYSLSDEHALKRELSKGSSGLIMNDYSDDQVVSGGELPVWLYYPSWAGLTHSFRFRSDDDFNDGGEVVFPMVFSKPRITLSTQTVIGPNSYTNDPVYLEITGKEEDFSFVIHKDNLQGEVIPYSDFDPVCFEHVYTPSVSFSGNVTEVDMETGSSEHAYRTTDDSYLGAYKKSTMNAEGYPEFCIFRKKIGTEYDIRSDRAVRLKNCSILFCPEVSNWRGMSGVHSARSTMNVYFLPFVSSDIDIAFPTKVHDYTLNKGLEKMDEPYCSSATVMASVNNAVFFCSDRSYFKMFAEPTSLTGTPSSIGGCSESVQVSQEEDGGPVKISFVETGTNGHSAGPHDIYASVQNKWSAQWDEPEPPVKVKLGSTNVYIHFVCGSKYSSTSSTSMVLSSEWVKDKNGMPNFTRTTVGQRYNDIKAAIRLSGGSIVGMNNKVQATYSMMYTMSSEVSGYATGSVGFMYGSVNLTYTDDGDILQGMVIDNSPEVGRFPSGFYADQHFLTVNKKIVDELEVKWGDFMDAGGGGYFVVHWLRNVCRTSNGWLNVFEAM